MRAKFLPSLLAFALSGPTFAQDLGKAKEVTLKWEKVDKTKSYDIEVYRDERVIKKISSKNEDVKFSLEPGYYQYTLRVVDIFDRPGLWSEKLPLAVLPPAPQAELPKDDEVIVISKPTSKLEFSWVAPPKNIRTKVIVKKNGKEVFSEVISGTKAALGPLSEGSFSWQVQYVLGNENQYATKASSERDFVIENGQLQAPVLKGPKGLTVVPSSSPGQLFEWEAVRGAKSYQFQIQSVDSGRKKEAVVTETQYLLPKMPLGRYTWKVTALSFMPGESKDSQPEKVIFSDYLDFAPGIDFKLGFAKGDAKYRINNAYTTSHVSTGSGTTDFYAGMDVWFHPKMSVSALGNFHLQNIYSSSSKESYNGQVQMKYRNKFLQNSGLSYQLGLGAEGRQMAELIANVGSRTETLNLLGVGALGALMLERGMKNRYFFDATYFYPLLISGPPNGTSLTGSKNSGNYAVQLKYARRFVGAWWGIGPHYGQRAVEFKIPLSPTTVQITQRNWGMMLDVTFALYQGGK